MKMKELNANQGKCFFSIVWRINNEEVEELARFGTYGDALLVKETLYKDCSQKVEIVKTYKEDELRINLVKKIVKVD